MTTVHTPSPARSTRIDDGAPAVTRQARVIAAGPEQVYALLVDVASWPQWQPAVSRVRLAGPPAPGTTFRWRSGVAITSTLTRLEPGRALAWTGRAPGTRAVHTWELEPVAGGTRVRTEESMSGWLPRLAPRTVQRTLERGVAEVLDRLAEAVAR